MARVELKNVHKIYGKDVVAVNDFNLSIADKEFIVLVGPSGCGKSTTLRMVAGLEDISRGELYIEEQLMNEVAPKDRNIAMVFQNYALYPHMSVLDNMAFGLRMRKMDRVEILSRVRNAADILGITDLLDRKPKALSGGQRQRVALGRAIVRNPKVFLFDEPLSNLDAKLRVQMRTEISKLHRRLETTMIYVTHDQVEAMTMGDRIVVMKDGDVMQIDTPLNLYNHPRNRFVASFIGSPAMNFLVGKIVRDSGLWFNLDGIRLEVSSLEGVLRSYIDKSVVFGIRPEHISEPGSAEPTNGDVSFQVEVVEPMGNENFLYGLVGRNSIVARVHPDTKPAIDSTARLTFDMTKAHFFDSATDEAILA